jgi:hypothetical protein
MVFSGIVLIMIVSFLAVLILMVMMLAQAVLRSGAVASAGYSLKFVG